MEFETTETARSTPSRHEKSLGLLTMKFVSLLQEAKDGVLDLKVVSKTARAGWVLWVVLGCINRCSSGTPSRREQRAVSHKRGRSGALICRTGGLASRHYSDLVCGFNNTNSNGKKQN